VVSWIAGLDPAFSSDPFGLALVGRDPLDRSRLVLGLARAWKPSRAKPESFEERRPSRMRYSPT
jgi:phage terminase large subunit-like protein